MGPRGMPQGDTMAQTRKASPEDSQGSEWRREGGGAFPWVLADARPSQASQRQTLTSLGVQGGAGSSSCLGISAEKRVELLIRVS